MKQGTVNILFGCHSIIHMGYGRREAVSRFKEQVKKSIEADEYKPTQEVFLEHCRKTQRRQQAE